jgi:hypothetical protein
MGFNTNRVRVSVLWKKSGSAWQPPASDLGTLKSMNRQVRPRMQEALNANVEIGAVFQQRRLQPQKQLGQIRKVAKMV